MTWWHRHRPVPAHSEIVGRTFAYDTCRCGLHRISWLDRGLPWWQSSWASQEDASRQLRLMASEAGAP